MLDAIELTTAIEAWQPDAECIAKGDEYLTLALRCYAAAGLCDAQIARRLLDLAGVSTPDEYSIAIGPETAAVIIARHLALCGMCARDITLVLADCGGMLPAWPDDPDLLIHIANHAVEEAA